MRGQPGVIYHWDEYKLRHELQECRVQRNLWIGLAVLGWVLFGVVFGFLVSGGCSK